MKVADIKEVNFLLNVIEKCEKGITIATKKINTEGESDVDSGGFPGFEKGYGVSVSKYSDGSDGVNLSGCYVEFEVYKSLALILEHKIKKAKIRLHELGVE